MAHDATPGMFFATDVDTLSERAHQCVVGVGPAEEIPMDDMDDDRCDWAGRHRVEGGETMAERRARLNADTPENNRRNAICAEAEAKIAAAFGRR